MRHLVLLGDSILDSSRYRQDGLSVREHLLKLLPSSWQTTPIAKEGTRTMELAQQFAQIPADASHFVLSVGGNDYLHRCGLALKEPANSFTQVLGRLSETSEQFRIDYRQALKLALTCRGPKSVFNIYDALPGLDRHQAAGLFFFNDVIRQEALEAGVPLIDLRAVCGDASDYSKSSLLEPTARGREKLARVIARWVQAQDHN